MSLLQVINVSKQQTGLLVSNISFSQQKLQKIAVAGETGSGKTTLLKMIAGLIQPDNGSIFFEDKKVKGPFDKLMPGHPNIAYLSQFFELLPHYRVEELIWFENNLPVNEAQRIFDICRITHLLKRKTDQLSGGEKQRISLCMLLIKSPKLLLLDEPFSNLDLIHKTILKEVIADVSSKLQITCMLSSHDPVDVLSWADEIIVMKQGEIVQKGNPKQIYHQPINEYVCGLFGNYNLINATEFPLLKNILHATKINKNILIRPENIHLIKNTGEEKNHHTIKAVIKSVLFHGSFYDIQIVCNGINLLAKTFTNDFVVNETVNIFLDADKFWYI